MLTKPVWPADTESLDSILNNRSLTKFPWEKTAKAYEKAKGESLLLNWTSGCVHTNDMHFNYFKSTLVWSQIRIISGRFTPICPVSQENKQGSYLSHNGHLLTVIWKLNLSLQLYSFSSLKEDIAVLDAVWVIAVSWEWSGLVKICGPEQPFRHICESRKFSKLIHPLMC